MVDSSKNNISYNNISLRIDLDDSSISMEKLKTWTPQNFTSILNNPIPQYSFYEDIKNKIYSGLYETSSNVELTDISKDFEKFTDISSPRSHSSGRSKISFKDLLNESYENYLKKIKNEFAIYKSNHHRKTKNQDLNSTRINLTEADDLTVYQSCSKIYKYVPNEFFSNLQFKIPKEILEKNRDHIERYCRELIEKCGDVEIEIERILQHSSKLYYYINKNLQPLHEDLEILCKKVNEMKEAKKFIKSHLLTNTSKTIKLGIKKNNTHRILQMMKNFKSLKDIIDLLRILSKDQSKYQLTQDLLNKGKDLISKLNINKRSPNIMKIVFEEFQKLNSKSLDKVQIEFGNILNEELSNLFLFKNENIDLEDTRVITDFCAVYDFDLTNFPGITTLASKILCSIEINEKFSFFENVKLKEVLQIIIKSDQEFFTKLRNILTKRYFDTIVMLNDFLNNLLYKKPSQSLSIEKLQIVPVLDNEKLDLLLLLTQLKLFSSIEKSLNKFKEFIINEVKFIFIDFPLEEKMKEIIRKKYEDELQEIEKIIIDEMKKLIISSISKNLTNAINQPNIDMFVESYDRVYRVACKYYDESNLSEVESKLNNSISSNFEKAQLDYLGIYFQNKNTKMLESIECEDWTAVKMIPSSHQNMINFITNFNLDEIKKNSRESIINSFICIGKYSQQEQNEEIQTTINIKTINNQIVSLKLILTTLDLIKVFYDSLKMLCLLDKINANKILSYLKNYLNTFILLVKSYILDGEAYRKGRIKRLSQSEVSIANSNACIVKNLITSVKCQNMFIGNEFEELLVNVDKIRHTCRYNMSDMLNSSIKESMEELSKLDFSSYPVCSEEDKRPLSDWVKKYHKFNPAYTSMIDSFEEGDIINTLQEILRIFFDKLEGTIKILAEKGKLTDSLGQKQFKRDMTAVKKNLKTFKLPQEFIENLQDKTDNITKIVLPRITKKKNVVEDK